MPLPTHRVLPRIGYDAGMVETPPVRLSSRLTFFYKFIFPTVWILGFAGGTLGMFMSRDPNARGPAIGFAIATVLGTVLLSASCFPLKTIVAAGDGIVVGNFFRKIEIPYAQVASIHENWLNRGQYATIWLNGDSPFGQRIKFLAYARFTLRFWTAHPALVMLRERVQQAHSRSSGMPRTSPGVEAN
jgi:hypothetical protein